MPEGILTHLGEGSEGYDALCTLLGVSTTKKKQEFSSQEGVKDFFKRHKSQLPGSKLPQREKLRHKIMAFYSNPKQRRLVWIANWENDSDAKDDSSVRLVASLEWELLKEHAPDTFTSNPDPIRLAECNSLYTEDRTHERWQDPALVALPDVKERLDRCSELSSGEKRELSALTYAVASLLDDARLLYWAAQLDEYFAREFTFLPVENIAEEDPNSEELISADFQTDLQKRVNSLINVAQAIVDGPLSRNRFDELADRYEQLRKLRIQYLDQLKSHDIEQLISKFMERLNEQVPDSGWLNEEIPELENLWRQTYSSSSNFKITELEKDIERAIDCIQTSCEDVARSQANLKEAYDKLGSLQATESDRLHGSTLLNLTSLRKAVDEAELITTNAITDAISKLRPNSSPSEQKSEQLILTVSTDANTDEHFREPHLTQNRPQPIVSHDEQGNSGSVVMSDGTGTEYRNNGDPTFEESVTTRTEQSRSHKTADTSASESKPLIPKSRVTSESSTDEVRDINEEAQSSEEGASTKSDSRADAAPPDFYSTTQQESVTPIQSALWSSIGSGRISLAYHIACLDQESLENKRSPHPDLLAAVLLGSHISGPISIESEDEFAKEFSNKSDSLLERINFDGIEPELRDALNLLLTIAVLRPGLFAAQTGSSGALFSRIELSKALSPFYELTKAVLEQARKLQGVYLNTNRLRTLLDEENWRECVLRHIELVRQWRSQATYVSFQHPPSNAIWQRWLKNGLLGDLVQCMTAEMPDLDEISKVNNIVEMLNDSKSIHKHVDETDLQELGRRGERLFGSAKNQLERRLREPLALAQTWLDLMEAQRGTKDYVRDSVESLRKLVVTLVPKCIDALSNLRNETKSVELLNALAYAETAIRSFGSLFRRTEEILYEDTHSSLAHVFTYDLMLVHGIRVNERGEVIRPTSKSEALRLLVDTREHASSLKDAFDYRIQHQDLYFANAICDRLNAELDVYAADAGQRLARAIDNSRNQLLPRLEILAAQLEQAFVIGEISDGQHATLNEKLHRACEKLEIDRQLSSASDGLQKVLSVPNEVEELTLSIEPAVERGIEKLNKNLEEHLPREDPHEEQLIQNALEEKDLATLYELLDCLNRRQPLAAPDSDACTTLKSFVEVATMLENEPNFGVNTRSIETVSKRHDMLGVKYSSLSTNEAKKSVELLEAWYALSRKAELDRDLTSKFFTLLGFSVKRDGLEIRSETHATVNVESLRQRELCPISVFGSKARGRYELISNWETPVRDRIVQLIKTDDPNSHTIVLHFGKLTLDDREWLRVWSIERRTPFIVIDEMLIFFLASYSDGLLRALFQCTLPFTCVEPYYTAPGLVPPESFYGREKERQIVMDPYGSCFVYGGRQLGKTALLHAAKTAFHEPASHHLAEFIDLRYEGVGTAYEAGHVWVVLWRVLKELGIIGDESTRPPGREGLTDAIKQAISRWLKENSERRILLLLDEADAFLEADRTAEYEASTSLKGLMEETGRRFKVVLCGLHNVLRNTERANHPLAHLGEPICIGPLLNDRDLNQARMLIREPMATVGYRFETDNLITRILLWTNYYPSLIQLFGDALVSHLREKATHVFPQVISSVDLQTVINRDDFRERIRERFIWTLQLDPRYEVTAYAMALELRGEDNAFTEGLTAREIFHCVREYWPEGFESPTKEFETLLQEMCGLGVLQHTTHTDGSRHFVFRNPNVMSLLGDDDKIEDVLAQQRSKPEIFDTASYHAPNKSRFIKADTI